MDVIYIQICLFYKFKRWEAYNLKCDILVITLFAMFRTAVNSKLFAFIVLFNFNHFQVYLAA